MKLFIMVGVPGSGKSTLAREIAREHKAAILSTDAIFEAPIGGGFEGALPLYLWNRDCIKQAHTVNQCKCQVAMELNINIIIDNSY